MSLAFDEFGRPFIIIRVRRLPRSSPAFGLQALHVSCLDRWACLLFLPQEQERKSRVKGIEAVKSNIQAAKAVSRVLRTSLGPKGMDKLLQGPDGDIVISEHRRRPLRSCCHPPPLLPPAAPRHAPACRCFGSWLPWCLPHATSRMGALLSTLHLAARAL